MGRCISSRFSETNNRDNMYYTLFLNIRTSKSGPDAQLFLIETLIVTLLRGIGELVSVKNDQSDPTTIIRRRKNQI